MTDRLVTLAESETRTWKARPGTVRIDKVYVYEDAGETMYRLTDQDSHTVTFRYHELTPEGKQLLGETE